MIKRNVTEPPILDHKNFAAPSIFAPTALLREARRQKGLAASDVPPICILDPDGDIVRTLRESGQAHPFESWPCYHTRLDTFALGGNIVGIVGCAVGAPFAVLVAEQLFASGCRLLISLTSAGQIVPVAPPPYFVIIDRALRDEGTSYHYGAPAIEWAQSKCVLAVEMEAAALYTFARAAGVSVLCLAHVTNKMGQAGQDFEKGSGDGTVEALAVLAAIAARADAAAAPSAT